MSTAQGCSLGWLRPARRRGRLAGIVYGVDGIPRAWLDGLRGTDVIERCLFQALE